MVPLSESPLLNLDTASVHRIDTTNTDDLHAFWSVCFRCAKTDSLHNAKRLENLSWRLYSQQTVSRSLERLAASVESSERNISAESVPGLSISPGSPASEEEMGTPLSGDLSYISNMESTQIISPDKLQSMIQKVTSNDRLEPLDTLPLPIAPMFASTTPHKSLMNQRATQSQVIDADKAPTTRPINDTTSLANEEADVVSPNMTFPTQALSADSTGPRAPSDSISSEVSTTSIIRGFSRENISSSRRSKVQLAPPQPILKQTSPQSRANPLKPFKKKTTFMIGASSEGDEGSSYESPLQQSAFSRGSLSYANSYDANHSESAIDDDDEDDDDGDWEEVDDAQQQEELFQRVQSSTNLRSRPSLLTNMLNQQDRARELENAASQSTPAIRRSRTSSHNGPLDANVINAGAGLANIAIPTSRDTHEQYTDSIPIAMSPRTNRRNMLSTELTGSLRKHLLWERQQRNPGNRALRNRQFRSEINLSENLAQAGPSNEGEQLRRSDTINFYDNGLQEYFEKGW